MVCPGLDVHGGASRPDEGELDTSQNNNIADDVEYAYEDLGASVFDSLVQPVHAGDDAPCMSEVLAIMFAWIGRHKATDVVVSSNYTVSITYPYTISVLTYINRTHGIRIVHLVHFLSQ